MPHTAPPSWAYLSLAASMALVGSYVGLSKLLVAVFPVLLLAWLRFGIAAVAMAHWVRRQPGEEPLSTRNRVLMFWESFLGNFLFSICMLYGVQFTSALAAGVTMAAIPAAVAVLSRVVLGELIRPRVAVAIACAMAGIALLALARPGEGTGGTAAASSGELLGYGLLLAAVLCEACYVVIGKRLTGHVSPRRISALINLWGLALVTPFGLWQALSFDFGAVALPTWGLLVFYAIAASMVTVWLWMQGLRHVPSSRAGVFSVLLPVSAALVGIVVLGETFGAVHVVAFALAMAGLLLATWPERRL
ncbi:DMT family transporter [Rubrivivax rivuli]|uniref:DMT family transporter n=1 Tax=Rubrivivax rivuli TaxID=1862385 RepID=A0A437RHC6_9BURK|nr:DMT family transporter [Rubrivivax rivuli]RVU46139.1 DMT family transporter [Rubrivivax rivuli]